ncbi:hypothetical protein QUB61_32315 [Microcoleus sp. C2D2]
MNRQDACSTIKFIFCGTGILPVADKGARSQLKPTGKNESFFKPFQKSYNIKPVGIEIIHHSLFFSSDIVFGCMGTIESRSIIPHSPTDDSRLPTPDSSSRTV